MRGRDFNIRSHDAGVVPTDVESNRDSYVASYSEY